MKLSHKTKRLCISLALLLCGVLALYPYLASQPQRHLRKSVAGLEKSVAAAILNDLALASTLQAKARALSAANGDTALAALADSLQKEAAALTQELSTLPDRSAALSEAAEKARAALDERLTRFLLRAAKDEAAQ